MFPTCVGMNRKVAEEGVADCYDKELEEQFYTIDCTADCPGVMGCDGRTYCNECMANAQGIRVE